MALHKNLSQEELAEAAEAHGLTVETELDELSDADLVLEVAKGMLSNPEVAEWAKGFKS